MQSYICFCFMNSYKKNTLAKQKLLFNGNSKHLCSKTICCKKLAVRQWHTYVCPRHQRVNNHDPIINHSLKASKELLLFN